MFNRLLNKLFQISLILFIFSLNFIFCSKKSDSYLILPLVNNTSDNSNFNNTNNAGTNPANSNLDLAFNSKGFVVQDMSSGYSKVNSMIVDSYGKILVAGHCFDGRNTNFCVAKFNPDGSLDTTFGNSGKVHINLFRNIGDNFYAAYSIEFDRSLSNYYKPILMSGYCNGRFCIIKLNYDGSLDKNFGSSGVVTLDPISYPYDDALISRYSILPSYGDYFLVAYTCNDANSRKFCVSKLYYNGALYTTFGTNGKTIIDIGSGDDYVTAIKFQSNKIVVTGSCSDGTSFKFCVARLNIDGSLDTTFGTNRKNIIDIASGDDYATSMEIEISERIRLGGYCFDQDSYKFCMASLKVNGFLDDQLFGVLSKVIYNIDNGNDFAYSLKIQSDGKILLGGHCGNGIGYYRFCFIRLWDNRPDYTFGSNGKIIADFVLGNEFGRSIAIQQDGKILLSGECDSNGDFNHNKFCIARFKN